MKIVMLDADTLGEVKNMAILYTLGDYVQYDNSSYDQVLGRIKEADIVITNKVVLDKYLIDNALSLKLICVAATGVNNIDLIAAHKKGVLVKNVSGYAAQSVAQQTFTMILSLTSHLYHYYNHVQSGRYSQGDIFTLVDQPIASLSGKVLGIIGLGAIGRSVAAIAKSFGMQIIYYSTSGIVRPEDYECVSLSELLLRSDVVSIHAPLNEDTKHLIGLAEMKKMKSSAILLNLGRGGIVVEADLVKALNNNVIYAAGLDVYAHEPLLESSELLTICNPDKLLLLPHIAWSTTTAREKLVEGIIENITLFKKL
jgi:lactate dehydrogenase-like 2-hydroxyacid dehydrogenase